MSSGDRMLLFVMNRWISTAGGIQTVNRELACAVKRTNPEISCAALVMYADKKEREDAWQHGVRLIAGESPDDWSSALLSNELVQLGERQPLSVIGHSYFSGEQALAVRQRFYPDAVAVHFVHMNPLNTEALKSYRASHYVSEREERFARELKFATRSDVVACIGPRLTRYMRDALAAQNAGQQVLRIDCGLARSDTGRVPPEQPTVLSLGRADSFDVKGLDILASAAGQLTRRWREHPLTASRPAPLFVVRGAEANPEQLEHDLTQRSASSGLQASFRVRPYTTDPSALDADFRGASVFVMPSREEGFGLVACEALSRGVPIVVSEESGIAEVIREVSRDQFLDVSRCIVSHSPSVEETAARYAGTLLAHLVDEEQASAFANVLLERMLPVCSWEAGASRLIEALNGRMGPVGPAHIATSAGTSAQPSTASSASRGQPLSFKDDAPPVDPVNVDLSSTELFDDPDELSRLLAFSVPDREVFHRVAAALGAELIRGLTPQDRWTQLVRWCVAHGFEQHFVALVSSETPDGTTSRLRAIRSENGRSPSLQGGRWQQRCWIEEALGGLIRRHAGEHVGGGIECARAAASDFNAWALKEVWGGTPPLPLAFQTTEQRNTQSNLSSLIQSSALTEGWWVATRHFGWAPPELGIALSALHMVTTVERSPELSRELIDWIGTHVTSLSQDQLEVVRLVAAWVPAMAERLEAMLLATARSDRLLGTSGRTALVELRMMVWALSYSRVGGAESEAETRAEVAREVVQAGFEAYVVDLLQLMGENRVDRLLALLSPVRDFDCRVAILRTVRQLLLARPQLLSAAENIEIAALRGSLPSAGAAEFEAIPKDPRTAYLWLRLLDWPLLGTFTPWVTQVANGPLARSQEVLALCTRLLTKVQS